MPTYEIIATQLCPDILAIFLLLFLEFLLRNNRLINKETTKHFLSVCNLTLLITVLEIGTVLFKNSTNSSLYFINILFNVLGFSLSPIVGLQVAVLYSKKIEKKKFILVIPYIINIFFNILSIFNGFIFHVTMENIYSRGPLFFIYVIVSIYSLFLFIYANYKDSLEYDKPERMYLTFLYVIIIFGFIIQINYSNMLLIWSCISISLFLYYIFLRELEFKFDALTGVRNRKNFDDRMQQLAKLGKGTIIVFDINKLKVVNDQYGHTIGDKYIKAAAKLIKRTFANIGITYRIGGDEFCVLTEVTDTKEIEKTIKSLDHISDLSQAVLHSNFSIAYGYAIYDGSMKESIYHCFSEADKAMYENKNRL